MEISITFYVPCYLYNFMLKPQLCGSSTNVYNAYNSIVKFNYVPCLLYTYYLPMCVDAFFV